jgi:hypothetical protein
MRANSTTHNGKQLAAARALAASAFVSSLP